LTQYLLTLQGPISPPVTDTALLERGAAVFAEQGCAECHVGAVGTNLQVFDVGTDGTFDTPSLRWLWLSAPYLHDGRAATLRDVFILPGAHQLVYEVTVEDLDALLAYLLSLPQG
jgi:cytochrome c peroxidase